MIQGTICGNIIGPPESSMTTQMVHLDHLCTDKMVRVKAGLSTFGALGKFNLSGPQKLFMQKLAVLPIIGQFICISYICMHACTISTLFAKGMVGYCYCVRAAVSAAYPISYITMKCVCNYKLYARYTQPPFLTCIYIKCKNE